MKLKKIFALLLVVCMTAALLAGCGGNSAGSDTANTTPADTAPATSDTGADTAPASSDASAPADTAPAASGKTQLNVVSDMLSQPNIHDLNGSWGVVRLGLAETLVRFGEDSSYQPWLATSWEVADDNLTWTFHLQEGVKFSNGADMTATKVKESIEYLYEVQDPANGGVGDIQSFMTYTSITADDAANTVTIVTAEPTADMPGVMAYPLTAIIDAEATRGRDMLLEGPIGTGPYVVTSYTDGHDYQLAKNPYYWDGEVPFETVNYVKVAEESSRYNALLDGSADIATHIQASNLPALESAGYAVSNVSGARDGYFHVNFEGPMGNDALRKAVFMAIDDETVCDITTGGSYTAGYTPLAPIFTQWGGADIPDVTAYNPEEAMKILDEAGIKDTDGDGWRELDGQNILLTYITVTGRQMADIAQAHATLIQAIGVNCEVKVVESQGDYMKSGTFDMVNSNEMIVPTGDPVNFLSHWYSESGTGYNYARYSNPDFDKAFEALKTEMDVSKRNECVKQLQQIMVDDSVLLLGGYYNFNICSAPTVTGVVQPPCDFYWITKDIKPAA